MTEQYCPNCYEIAEVLYADYKIVDTGQNIRIEYLQCYECHNSYFREMKITK